MVIVCYGSRTFDEVGPFHNCNKIRNDSQVKTRKINTSKKKNGVNRHQLQPGAHCLNGKGSPKLVITPTVGLSGVFETGTVEVNSVITIAMIIRMSAERNLRIIATTYWERHNDGDDWRRAMLKADKCTI